MAIAPLAISALIAALPSIISLFKGKPKSETPEQLSNFNPQQQQGLTDVLKGLSPENINAPADYWRRQLSNDPEALQRLNEPYMKYAQENIVPQLSAQFGGFAGPGGSGSFQNALQSLQSSLGTNLAALQQQGQSNAAQNLASYTSGLGSLGLGAQPFSYFEPGQQNTSGLSANAGNFGNLLGLLSMYLGSQNKSLTNSSGSYVQPPSQGLMQDIPGSGYRFGANPQGAGIPRPMAGATQYGGIG